MIEVSSDIKFGKLSFTSNFIFGWLILASLMLASLILASLMLASLILASLILASLILLDFMSSINCLFCLTNSLNSGISRMIAVIISYLFVYSTTSVINGVKCLITEILTSSMIDLMILLISSVLERGVIDIYNYIINTLFV